MSSLSLGGNVAELFRTKSPSLAKCKEGSRSPSFELFLLDIYENEMLLVNDFVLTAVHLYEYLCPYGF